MEHLANVGPLAISIYADNNFMNYSTGVYDGCDVR